MTLRLLSVALCLFPFANENASSSDWPHWRGPERTGVSPETGWQTEGAEEPLWSMNVGRGYSAPSIAQGRLFTRGFFLDEVAETEEPEEPKTDESTDTEGGEGEEKPKQPKLGEDVTFCLDATTGKELWRHTSSAKLWNNMHGGGTLSTPCVEGDTVYVLSRMGMFWALDVENGDVRWEHDLAELLEVKSGFFGLSSSPLILGETVYINVGKTVALDKRTGEIQWQTDDYGYSYGTPVPFEWNDKKLLAIFNAKGLAVLDQSNGEELALHDWTSRYNVNCATPIVLGNRIFISTGYDALGCTLLEFGEDGLKPVWASREMSNQMNGCVFVDGVFYGFDKTMLKCISLDEEGKELWNARGFGRGTVIASDKRLIVLSEDGELSIGEANTEGFEATYKNKIFEGGPCWTTPVLAGGLIYCRNGLGELACLDHRAAD